MNLRTCLETRPGEFPVERLPDDFGTAKIMFTHRNGRVESRYEIIELKTSKRYRQEPMLLTAFKCFEIFLFLPIYFLGYTALHLARLPIVTWSYLDPGVSFEVIRSLVRVPFYFIALEFAAAYGIFRPLHGRVLFGYLERQLHDGKSRHCSINFDEDKSTLIREFLTEKKHDRTVYLGYCMQPIGEITDPHIQHFEYQMFQDA